MADPKGLYSTLDVSPGATEEEIKKAYRRLALRWHPDKNPDDPEATGRFQSISNAYAVLSDPQQRRFYDETGAVGQEGIPEAGFPGDIDEMMEMFAAAFEGMRFGDGLDDEIAAMFGAGNRRTRRKGKIPQRLRTAAAPGAKAPRPRGGGYRSGPTPEELLMQEMFFGAMGGGPGGMPPFGFPGTYAGDGPCGAAGPFAGAGGPFGGAGAAAAAATTVQVEEVDEEGEEKKPPPAQRRGHNQPLRPKKGKKR